jgi:hypothetical protein
MFAFILVRGDLSDRTAANRAVFGLNSISPAQTGLLLTEMLSITGILGIAVRQTAEIEV